MAPWHSALSLPDALPISARGLELGCERRDALLELGRRFLHAADVGVERAGPLDQGGVIGARDRKSTRLNSSHVENSYAVSCLKKKKSLRYRHLGWSAHAR